MTMALPQAGKMSANDDCGARFPIDAQCRRVERGMTAVQPAGSIDWNLVGPCLWIRSLCPYNPCQPQPGVMMMPWPTMQ